MRLSNLLLAYLLVPVFGQSTYSKSVCYTKYGSKSISPPLPSTTVVKAVTLTAIRVAVIVPTKTITPGAKTTTTIVDITSTITSVAPVVTDTFSTTITSDTTLTSVVLETITTTFVIPTTVTTFPNGETTTVTTNSGFLPIKSVPGNPPSRRQATAHARRVPEPIITDAAVRFEERQRQQKGRVFCELKDGQPFVSGRFPSAVSCVNNIKVVNTKTLSFTWFKTATVTAPKPTITITDTRFHTTTTVIQAVRASTTISTAVTNTFTTQSTTTLVSPTTILNTQTVSSVPTTTAYPGCGPDNFINSANGYGINYWWLSGTKLPDTVSFPSNNAEACCRACFDRSDCTATSWTGNRCELYLSNTCQPQNILFWYGIGPPTPPGSWVFSNGNCGRFGWDGEPPYPTSI
ncbi:hypothetical protein B0J11DRAFT_586107 [Dendryphion nanum]|uniref:Apple domain-containing protein n=1 Tax=Dendryphion nanum TaxID=256645 RepID=A0A9P9D1W8_9PLEO|nr:hypothetical protein B0J11DRAFT_586107 [Dendryphion nanum]